MTSSSSLEGLTDFRPVQLSTSEYRSLILLYGEDLFITVKSIKPWVSHQWLPIKLGEGVEVKNIAALDEDGDPLPVEERESSPVVEGGVLDIISEINEFAALERPGQEEPENPNAYAGWGGRDNEGNLLLVRRNFDSKKITPDEVVLAIFKGGGFTQAICRVLNCSVRAYYYYLRHFPACREALTLMRERRLDFAEGKLFEKISEGDTGAIKYYLTTQGKQRGYVTRLELELVVQTEIDRLLDFLEGRLPPYMFDELLQVLMKYESGLGLEFPTPDMMNGVPEWENSADRGRLPEGPVITVEPEPVEKESSFEGDGRFANSGEQNQWEW